MNNMVFILDRVEEGVKFTIRDVQEVLVDENLTGKTDERGGTASCQGAVPSPLKLTV